MADKPLAEDFTDAKIDVSPAKDWAVGPPAILHSMVPAFTEMGPARTLKLASTINHTGGYDCPSCAWADPTKRSPFEFCENGIKAVTWEATPTTVPSAFWEEHSLSSLDDKSEYWLGMQGRLVEPVYKRAGSDHYEPIGWDDAFEVIARHLNALESPDRAAFYTSGKIMNEPAFLYQLFVRAFGTNNLPDCSNMCHESTGVAMVETIGVGKSTVHYDDFGEADLIIVMGQNPGTNHPRMLTALEECKRNGGSVVAVNALPEAGLIRYKNPQHVRGILGRGTEIADQFLHIRLGGDLHLLQAVAKRVLAAEAAKPGTVLDHDFLDRYTAGFEAFAEHLETLDEADVLAATGLSSADIDELAERYIRADRVIITWAMGLTQHKKAVPTIREVMNLLFLRGNIGRPGAGASPIRGHSNVQGDRTMGIWEQMPDSFLDALGREFSFEPPRPHGLDSVDAVRATAAGDIDVWFGLGGNLVAAISDSNHVEAAMRGTKLTVQVSTKLNRSHVVTGEEALILPTLGRTEIDRQATGPQFGTVEDSVCSVHASAGQVEPVAEGLLSDVAIICRTARAVLGDRGPAIDWEGFERDYDLIRESIARVVPGCDDYNAKVRLPEGFILPHPPRDSRTFITPSGKAVITVNERETIERPAGRLLLQTVRSHDQFNTTMYSLNDRYRGIKKGRFVVFVNPDDLTELGLADGQTVDVFSEWPGEPDRVLRGYRIVAFPTARGCAAAYFPEANALIPLESVAEGSNTPVSKSVVIRLEPSSTPAATGRPVTV
ncbi:FdhF/YdeP family oxidoreductase [Agromyces atrinae]|uniref:FdhF/YdeP family oxidoreductase n=1 Tax=Agromyces atrinae TaxID=592376 RepID=A0A4Q2M098_9MICO|nr:FdhF/YdeP family oxidoreductase [Agromyces atrinae]NYD67001.1 formate dehydrogenase major subunit [Agromyces atrinae]RXZ85265.1 FdhF/YdeP family oxidoreductase [Agromyces atrinae]RXZ85373.1 FdhF/YdeP family oxidoreductase [Agromyces atrinae]